MRYDNFRIQRKNQLTVSLKYFILVLLLMSLFHTSILSEKTRFGYPFGVPCLVFFCGGCFATRPAGQNCLMMVMVASRTFMLTVTSSASLATMDFSNSSQASGCCAFLSLAQSMYCARDQAAPIA